MMVLLIVVTRVLTAAIRRRQAGEVGVEMADVVRLIERHDLDMDEAAYIIRYYIM